MAKPKVIFVLGGPGCGKGTQCSKISEKYNFIHLSAGDCLREERNKPNSPDAQLIETYIKEGKIVPVNVTVKLIKAKMESMGWENGKFIIDGFPRSQDNLQGWQLIMGNSIELLFCLYLECHEEAMLARLIERGKHSGRSDDNVESIKKRFETFKNQSLPIINEFEAANKVQKVSAMQSIEDVWADVQKIFTLQKI